MIGLPKLGPAILNPVINAVEPSMAAPFELPDPPTTSLQRLLKDFVQHRNLFGLMNSVHTLTQTEDPERSDMPLFLGALQSCPIPPSQQHFPPSPHSEDSRESRYQAMLRALNWGYSLSLDPLLEAVNHIRVQNALDQGNRRPDQLPHSIMEKLRVPTIACQLACRVFNPAWLGEELKAGFDAQGVTPQKIIGGMPLAEYADATTRLFREYATVSIEGDAVRVSLFSLALIKVKPRHSRVDDIDCFLAAIRATPAAARLIAAPKSRAKRPAPASELIHRLRPAGYSEIFEAFPRGQRPRTASPFAPQAQDQLQRKQLHNRIRINATRASSLARSGNLVFGAFDMNPVLVARGGAVPAMSRRGWYDTRECYWVLLESIGFGGSTSEFAQVKISGLPLNGDPTEAFTHTMDDFCDTWCSFVSARP